ncbi:MAG: hypothetical protein DCC65_09960 [Planctomycetota bacterium]|nr:MAG: hypothetical protein DCC65_09960 [Planctomycetota bacterium]
MHPRLIRAAWTVAVVLGVSLSTSARGHDVDLTRVRITVRADRTYDIDVHYDVRAHLAGIRPEHLTPSDLEALAALSPEELDQRIADLKEYAQRRVRVYVDGGKNPFEVEIVDVEAVASTISSPTSQPTSSHASPISRILRVTGRGPPEARDVVFWASKSFGNIVLEVFDEAGRQIGQQLLEKGSRSEPIPFESAQAELSGLQVAWDYIVLGFEHILPEGLDHILFVLGLFLLSARMSPLLWQVTAFTVAHSVTLALSTYGVIRLSSFVVEPLIALSIAYVAIENMCTRTLHAWRPVVVFLFGLLHGLGFAGVLEELGLPRGRFVTALVSFNVGVELGQLAVIAMALGTVGWMRNYRWYRSRVVVPASGGISIVGLYWSVERLGLLG